MAGRIDTPEFFWTSFRDGKFMIFEDDASTIKENGVATESEQIAGFKLMASFGKNRYSEMLKDKDLSNIIYVHADKDTNTGKLTKEEDFLTSKNAKILFLQSGNHNSILTLLIIPKS